jgi:hypothetical protein
LTDDKTSIFQKSENNHDSHSHVADFVTLQQKTGYSPIRGRIQKSFSGEPACGILALAEWNCGYCQNGL